MKSTFPRSTLTGLCVLGAANLCMVQIAAAENDNAEQSDTSAPVQEERSPWDFTLGGTLKTSDLAKLPGSAKLEPVVGLQSGRWKLGIGDSNTLDLGVSYVWLMDRQSEMTLNGGVTWATAEHWRHAYGPQRLGAETLRTGIDSWGLGLNYKHRIVRHWAWFTSLSLSGDAGPLAQLLGMHIARAGQVGLLYFHR
jgi:hypothetical protein